MTPIRNRAQRIALWLWAPIFALAFITSSAFAGEPPRITTAVNDDALVLSAGAEERMATRLHEHQASTQVQLAVLVVGSTKGEPIEDYALRAATQWSGGRSGEDFGALFVLAVHDRRMRLEVGYGLEAYIPDAVAKRVLDRAIPHLRAKDYDAATEAVVEGVIELTTVEVLAQPPNTALLEPPDEGSRIAGAVVAYFLAFMFASTIAHILRGGTTPPEVTTLADAEEVSDSVPAEPARVLPSAKKFAGLVVTCAALGGLAQLLGYGEYHYWAALLGCVAGWAFLWRSEGLVAFVYLGLLVGFSLGGVFVIRELTGDESLGFLGAGVAQAFVTLFFLPFGSGGSSSTSFSGGGASSSVSNFGSTTSFFSGGSSTLGGSSGFGGGGGFSGGGGSFGGGGASSSW